MVSGLSPLRRLSRPKEHSLSKLTSTVHLIAASKISFSQQHFTVCSSTFLLMSKTFIAFYSVSVFLFFFFFLKLRHILHWRWLIQVEEGEHREAVLRQVLPERHVEVRDAADEPGHPLRGDQGRALQTKPAVVQGHRLFCARRDDQDSGSDGHTGFRSTNGK